MNNVIASMMNREGWPRRLARLVLTLALASAPLAAAAPAAPAAGAAAGPAAAVSARQLAAQQPAAALSRAAETAPSGAAEEQPQSWLLRWSDPALAHELRGVEVLHRQEQAAVLEVRPAADAGEDVDAWLGRLRSELGVAYVEPNSKVSILSDASSASTGKPYALQASSSPEPQSSGSGDDGGIEPTITPPPTEAVEVRESDSQLPTASPSPTPTSAEGSDSTASTEELASGSQSTASAPIENQAAKTLAPVSKDEAAADQASVGKLAASPVTANDPELAKQKYLEQIGAPAAWKTQHDQSELIIALVDTGVDLDHPDLKANLIPGINLLDESKTADDDNGHGTSVAGVIAAAGNNGTGVSGIVWHAKLMPIKALDEWGDGTEKDLGEAIMYAVDHGAKIVELSVGLHRYSPYMLDIVQYAEDHGVLLVAASGNDGLTLGDQVAVKYPAAYPTVLAVGGARADNTPDPRSNSGTELDLLAPWSVYTTEVGGSYHAEEGTSMSAPQVAAAAALILAQHPAYKPYQVRALLRQSAKDIGAPGVDSTSGYGILQIDKALAATLSKDAFEPNDSEAQAAVWPIQTEMNGELASLGDTDWFAVDAPYAGKLTLQWKERLTEGQSAQKARISLYEGSNLSAYKDVSLASDEITFEVRKGRQLIKLQLAQSNQSPGLSYTISNSFVVAPDSYEPNDRSDEAAVLAPGSQTVKGNFHQTADRDWFEITFKQEGRLQLTLSTDFVRIDPGLSVQRDGQPLMLYDDHGEGEAEQSPFISITPGKYYIRVHNAISTQASPTLGEYSLKLDFQPQLADPNEPNDKSYEALEIKPTTEYVGVFDKKEDKDWFQFRLTGQSVVSLAIDGVPLDVPLRLQVFDKQMNALLDTDTGNAGNVHSKELVLPPDIYYVLLTAPQMFQNQYYRLKLNEEGLVSGFRDIAQHWARKEIVSFADKGFITGYSDQRFEPERSITRAEAAAVLVRAFVPMGGDMTARNQTFTDAGKHWASDYIAKAAQKKWVQGFPDGSFHPDEPITRAEMAVMISRVKGLPEGLPMSKPFEDVELSKWYASALYAMKQDGKLNGSGNNLFFPENTASRAEFVSLLYRYYTSS
ncbi:S8 family serine peptidase [Paenibacillus sp. HB172176]|uniref:S8 family serine peptidase n=1 Tax=Paenibacillus sp. HB172176 TaxID=2493690 RepID=UPI001438CB47|nr:S8 family serine peptidase [Paenibacillus sp. HB172176]